MDFPSELWPDETDLRLVRETADLFADAALTLTDELTNSVYLNDRAERLMGDEGGALVNRAACSLLGYGERGAGPPALEKALLGEAGPWRCAVQLPGATGPVVCEASAIRRDGRLLCGVLRFGKAG